MEKRYENMTLAELRELERALLETMRASDDCMTWGYYGRSSREQLPGVRQAIYEKGKNRVV
jgi:hypothetical protein